MYRSRRTRTEEPAVVAGSGAPDSEFEWHAARALVRNRTMIALMALGLALLLPVIAKMVPARYMAVTEVVIDPSELQIVDKSLRPSAQLTDGMIAQVESQVRVLLSTNVLKRVIETQKLGQDPEFNGEGGIGKFLSSLRGAQPEVTRPELNALRELSKRVGARRVERTFVVDVSAWSSDPEKSVRIADALVDAFMEERSRASAEAARQASAALMARLEPLRLRVLAAEEKVETFKRQNKIHSAGGQLVDEQQLSAISSQLVLARARVAEAEAQYNQINAVRKRGADAGAIPEAVRSATLGVLRSQLSTAVRREAQLSATLLPSHPLMVEARQQVLKARKEVEEEIGRIATAAQSELQRARGGAKSLADGLESARRELTGTNEKMVRLRALEREAKAERLVYEAMLQRTQEVLEQEKIDAGHARVISRAELPERPYWPPRKLWLFLLGIILGTTLGAVLVLVNELVPWSRLRREPGHA